MSNDWQRALAGGLGIFVAIAAIGLTGAEGVAQLTMIGSFGSSSVVVFFFPELAIARPRNVLGGHLICSGVGVACLHVLGGGPWSLAASVAIAAALMHVSGMMHPPAGGNPITAYVSGAGPMFVLAPTALGVVLLLACALLWHRCRGVRYPPG